MTARARNHRRPAGAANVRRRALALAGVVLVLAGVNLVVLGAVTSTGELASATPVRVDALRATLAAEAGAALAAAELAAGRDLPTGTIDLADARLTLDVEEGPPVVVTVTAVAGDARRRLLLTIE